MSTERKPKGNHLISYRKFATFIASHPGAKGDEQTLRNWGKLVEGACWRNFSDVRESFASADLLPGNLVCFNVGGNKYRVVARIYYSPHRPAEVQLREVMTHAEYDVWNRNRR